MQDPCLAMREADERLPSWPLSSSLPVEVFVLVCEPPVMLLWLAGCCFGCQCAFVVALHVPCFKTVPDTSLKAHECSCKPPAPYSIQNAPAYSRQLPLRALV